MKKKQEKINQNESVIGILLNKAYFERILQTVASTRVQGCGDEAPKGQGRNQAWAWGGLSPLNDAAAPPPNADGIPSKSYVYLYIIGLSSLLLNVFCQAQIVSKSMAAGASPQTPLGG